MTVVYKSDLGVEIEKGPFDVYVSRFGGYLQSVGVEKGDRVAVMMPNILQFPIAARAVLNIGAVLVNVNPLYTAMELKHLLKDSGAKVIVAFNGAAEVIDEVVNMTDDFDTTVVMTAVGDMVEGFKGTMINMVCQYTKNHCYPDVAHDRFWDVLTTPEYVADSYTYKGSDLALIQYTGGTTGRSKGVELTHANLSANVEQIIDRMGGMIGKGDVVVSPLPFYHVYAFIIGMKFLRSVGACSLLVANPRDIPKFVKTLQKTEFTGFIGLNTLFNALVKNKNFSKVDFSNLKITISGGMPLTKDIATKWQEATGSNIAEGYGLTETSPVLCLNDPFNPMIGAVGKPVKGVKIKIADDGEILAKGPNVFKRYWNNKAATKEAFTFFGWFKTGDIGEFDNDGNLKITDRKKNMIIVSGFNVFPTEIEDALTQHKLINEAGVVGISDGKGNEKVVAFVVKSEDDNITEEAVREFAKEHLTKYKVPREVRFVKELPKTPVGKVLHRELKKQYG